MKSRFFEGDSLNMVDYVTIYTNIKTFEFHRIFKSIILNVKKSVKLQFLKHGESGITDNNCLVSRIRYVSLTMFTM